MAIMLRPLSLGELLDRVFQLYRSRFGLFVGIAAVAYIPLFVVRAALLWVPKASSAPVTIAAAVGLLIGIVLQLLGVAAASAATITAVSAAYLEQPITLREAYGRVSGMLLRVFLLMIVTGIGVGIGFLLLIVPGIILFLMWALAVPVTVLEDAGIGESFSRSRELTRGHRGRVFVIYLLYIVLVFALDMGLLGPIGALAAIKNGSAGLGAFTSFIAVASIVVNYIVECLITPVLTIALSLMYYDERVRKEAFDIQLMMSAAAEGPSQSTAVL